MSVERKEVFEPVQLTEVLVSSPLFEFSMLVDSEDAGNPERIKTVVIALITECFKDLVVINQRVDE
jgi:hypothetical protein